jgi:hypothetical protein
MTHETFTSLVVQRPTICPKGQHPNGQQMCDYWSSSGRDVSAHKCTITIVEDDASFRRALERSLRASGFEAHTFGSAEEFLNSAMPESHACLILDI